MKSTVNYLSMFLIMSLFVGCNGNKSAYCDALEKNKDGQTVIKLQQQWTANSGFAGELYAKYETAALQGFELDVIEGTSEVSTIDRVLMGQAQFGVAGAEQVIQANRGDVKLVVIGVINYKSLTCFISKKEKNIVKVADMKNRNIGVMSGTPVDMVYQVLKRRNNLQVKEVAADWSMDGFRLNRYDVHPSFFNDEPVTLGKEGIELNIIRPEDYGVNFMGTVYFCKKELIDSCPQIVQNFVNAIADGWEGVIKDKQKAMEYLQQYSIEKNSAIDIEKEERSLSMGIDYYKGEDDKVLFAKKEIWDSMVKVLEEINIVKKIEFNYDEMVDNRFVVEYMNKKKNENTDAK